MGLARTLKRVNPVVAAGWWDRVSAQAQAKPQEAGNMKTTWKFETVQAGRSGREEHEWLRAKQLDFEQKTGVAWSYENAHGMYIFNACMRAVDAQHADGDAADRIIAWMNTNGCWGLKYVRLLDISEGTGLPLTVVCGTCWALVKNQQLKVTVDRMGKPTAVALSR